MSEEKIGVLEQRMDAFSDTQQRIETKVDGVLEALQSLARIEERQLATSDRLRQGAETFQDHEKRIRELELALPDNLDKRLVSIETKMPGLIESRKWIVMGIIAGAGMIGLAVLHLVMK